MRVTRVILFVVCGFFHPAFASVESSLRPQARGEAAVVKSPVSPLGNTRPVARPAVVEAALASQLAMQFRRENHPNYRGDPADVTQARARAFAALSKQATGISLRPFTRPDQIVREAMAQRRERARGAICGDPDIQGDVVGLVPGRIRGCGVQQGVRVKSVSGITLSQASVLDCTTAKALKKWVSQGMKPAVGTYGGGVRQIKVAAHYACRTRNNQPGARISEHGKGRAIDVSGFVMRDGSEISLLQGWGQRTTGAILRDMHKRACGVFGTVLGPDSNRFHRDHFHFDTARYRSGSFCR